MSHDVHWYTPAPLWSNRLGDGARDRFAEPTLLRFQTDAFMEELGDVLDSGNAARFENALAVRETYRGGDEPTSADVSIPLYQPAHQRYYLVTASLVCRERGLPDRGVDTTADERVSFVLRRIDRTDTGTSEYGWFGDAWRAVNGGDPHVASGEERLPMFPQSFVPDVPLDRLRRPRRVWTGLVPVAKREVYEAAPVEGDDSANGDRDVPNDDVDANGAGRGLGDPRLTQFETQVMGALSSLRKRIADGIAEVQDEDVQAPFVYALLDLYEFLSTYAADVARWIRDPNRNDPAQDEPIREQLDQNFPVWLKPPGAQSAQPVGTWADALSIIAQYADGLNDGTTASSSIVPIEAQERNGETLVDHVESAIGALDVEAIRSALQTRLSATPPSNLPDVLTPPVTRVDAEGAEYVVRCLYERPRCRPFEDPVLSTPSRPFRMASFFDADAPARPLRITLPGAKLSDFRKSPKGVSFLFTSELRKQAQRIQDITLGELDDGEIGSAPGVNIGMICSLSIPIITICALILLLVIVFVLNIVFWWLPFFKICFPLPTRN